MLKRFLDLKAHNEWLQTTLANLHEAVVVTDTAGGVTFMNAAARAFTGWEPAAAQGRSVEDVIRLVGSRDTRLPPRGAVGMAWETDQNIDLAGHYLWRACDGTVLPIVGRATAMRDGAGNLLGAVWVFRDATADRHCGQILTELLANAFKHAFPAGRPGAIEVTLRADPAGTCVLTVCDDGVGFPTGLDVRQADSFGLQLVCLLTEQLGGTIEMTRGYGTHWRLMFPIAISPAQR